MTTVEKTYTDKQQAFIKALPGKVRGDIRNAMDICGYERS